MTWFGWVLIACYVWEVVWSIAQIHQPRKPIRPSDALGMSAIAAALIVGIVVVGTNR